jgi:hypothetical protein
MTVYNRTASKCSALQEKGARVVNTPAEVAEHSGTPMPRSMANQRLHSLSISVFYRAL